MTKLIICALAGLALGCQPTHHWRMHHATTCTSLAGSQVVVYGNESVLVIVHQANGRSRVIYKNQEMICPTESIWAN